MKYKFLSFVGYAGSGKDLCYELLGKNYGGNKYCSDWSFNIKKFSNARALKDIAAILTGHSIGNFDSLEFKTNTFVTFNNKVYSIREFLQHLGQNLKEFYGNELWKNIVERDIKKFLQETSIYCSWDKPEFYLVKTDDRFPFELESSKNLGGYLIWIERDFAPGRKMTHISETILEESKKMCDYTLINNGSKEELEKSLLNLVETLEWKNYENC